MEPFMKRNGPNRSAGTTVRNAVKSVLFSGDDTTTIEECRRCGKTIESSQTTCPVCDCNDIVEYRIR